MTIDLNFNNAEPQRDFALVPTGAICVLHLTVRPGGVGDGGWLSRSKDGRSEGLDFELTVAEGEHAKQKMWTRLTLAGTTDGHLAASEISGRTLRAILESARGIKTEDQSEAAAKARTVANFGEFDGLRFMARIGIEPARGEFKAKNFLSLVITPSLPGWRPIEQVPAQPKAAAPDAAKSASAPVIERPVWAK